MGKIDEMALTSLGAGESARVRAWQDSGIVGLTGHRDGEPLVPPGAAAQLSGRLYARVAESARLSGRQLTGDGATLLSERASLTGATRNGRTSVGGSSRMFACADGWIAVSCARQDDPALLGALIGAPLWEADREKVWSVLRHELARWTRKEFDEAAELFGVAGASLRTDRPSARVSDNSLPGVPSAVFSLELRPVAGLRVVDFSALWAGPLAARLLSDAGASVVKVETTDRPDGARFGNQRFYERLHSGHESVIVQPESPAGRRRLWELVEEADVVIEASRPRALERWGLDAHAFAAKGGTWLSITAAGRSSSRVGFGDDVAASAGLVATDCAGDPVFCGDAIADPLTGITVAALAVCRPPDSTGALWDCSMTDIVHASLPASQRSCGRS